MKNINPLKSVFSRFLQEITNTGERPRINTYWEDMDSVLQFAYKFAAQKLPPDSTVLDFGCGGGYGSEYLSRSNNNQIIGFDQDSGTIRYNRVFFRDVPNLKFCCDLTELKRYDVVVLFQVIEHMDKRSIALCLQRIKSLLNQGGVLFISTVNKNISSFKLKKPILPFHVYEFNPKELSDLLKQYFQEVACTGQIDEDAAGRIHSEGWFYQKEYDKGFRNRFVRSISQVGLVRFVARHTPLFVKSIILGSGVKSKARTTYRATCDPWEIENSYVLIYECKL